MININVEITDKRLHGRTLKATEGACAIDLYACIKEPLIIREFTEAQLIPTGFKMSLPKGYGAFLLPRSGLGHKEGLVLGNLVGLIDSDYRGEVYVSAWVRNNGQNSDFSYREVRIEPMDRIAQMVVMKTESFNMNTVPRLDETERGEGGFGSTGTK